MPSRLRIALLLALSALAFGLVACGGDDAASEDVDTLLEETFASGKQVDSGVLDLKLNIEAQGSQQQGPINIRLAGPFQSEGDKKLPRFQFDVTFEGAGQSFNAGATSTGDKGFVKFQGTDYVVSDEIFAQFKQGFEQAQEQSGGDEDPSLATLGIDPRKWLTDAKNEGEAKVGDDDAIKITGGVDIEKLLDDVNVALDKARGLGLQGAGDLPSKLTDEQRKAVTDAVKDVSVEIYTGAEDKILRRMLINLAVEAPEGTEGVSSADIVFDMSITDVNEDQEVTEPEDAQPLDQLLGQLGGLGLGGLGGGAGAGGAGSGSGSGSGSGGAAPDPDALQEYSECVRDAGTDAAAAQECAELLAP